MSRPIYAFTVHHSYCEDIKVQNCLVHFKGMLGVIDPLTDHCLLSSICEWKWCAFIGIKDYCCSRSDKSFDGWPFNLLTSFKTSGFLNTVALNSRIFTTRLIVCSFTGIQTLNRYFCTTSESTNVFNKLNH